MAIRLKKEAWAIIRAEYEAGTTAAELAEKYVGVKAASIHARACREKWREIVIPRKPSQFAVIRAQIEGISIEDATELESSARSAMFGYHRGQAFELDAIVAVGLGYLGLAMKNRDQALIDKCHSLSLATKAMAFALSEKVKIERLLYGMEAA